MDYMEMSSVPKSMLEKLLAMTSESYRATGPIKNGFRPLAGPLFNPPRAASPAPSKGVSLPPLPTLSPAGGKVSSDFPRRESILPFPGLLPEGVGKDSPGASAGTGLVQKASNGSLIPVEETVEKVKQKRVRKSRASGTPRKRVKADPAVDGNTAAVAEPPATASAPPKRRRARAKATTNGENAEKPPPKRRNRPAANTRKTKEAQIAFLANSGQSFNTTQNGGYSEAPTKGILGVYGLNAKAVDLTRYMKEISLESLICGDFKVASPTCRQGLPPSSGADDSFGKHVSSILQVLSKPANAELCQPSFTFVSANQPECKPQKLMLDLESAPRADNEDFPCSLVDRGAKHCPQLKDLPDTSAPENRKPLETQSLFAIETLPVFPLTEFWNKVQLQPTDSLESLLSQATVPLDGRSVSSQIAAKTGAMAITHNYKTDGLPPFPFSLNSVHPLHENACDRYSRVNYWFRAGSLKSDASAETCFGNLTSVFQESRPPFKADGENDSGRLGQKEGLMDIDLNKQSPEAEAADTMKHSSVLVPERLQVPSSEHSAMERDSEKREPACMGEQQEHKLTFNEPADSMCSEANKVSDGSPVTLTEKVVTGEIVEELDPTSACDNSSRGGLQCDPPIEHPMLALFGAPSSSCPSVQRGLELWNDVPYSPRGQAAAHLLCKMAISSSPFFVDNDEVRAVAFSTCNDASSQRISKAPRVGPSETGERAHKYISEHESRDNGPSLKNQVGEGRKKLLSQVVNGYAPAFGKPNALAQSRERSFVPSRNVPKITKTRINQSSESDRSPDHGIRERSRISNDVHGQVIKTENCLPSAVASSRTPNPSVKESRGSHTTVSKVNSLYPTHTRGTTGPVQMRSTAVSGTEQPIYGEALSKIGHPRSSSAKNCFLSQRNASSYPVKPRNTSSWAVKSARQIQPFAGEVRQGAKRLDTK